MYNLTDIINSDVLFTIKNMRKGVYSRKKKEGDITYLYEITVYDGEPTILRITKLLEDINECGFYKQLEKTHEIYIQKKNNILYDA